MQSPNHHTSMMIYLDHGMIVQVRRWCMRTCGPNGLSKAGDERLRDLVMPYNFKYVRWRLSCNLMPARLRITSRTFVMWFVVFGQFIG